MNGRGRLEHGVRSIGATMSPRHRQWRRLLRSLTLTPVEASGELHGRNLIICGCPRSGTALMTAALFQPPAIATVMEPWDGLRMPPRDLLPSLRSEMMRGQLSRGRLRVDLLQDLGEVRWQRDGEQTFGVAVDRDTTIGVKWPTYWQLLGKLTGPKFVVCVRDPAEVVRSFEQQGGRLARGLDYDVAFNSDLNAMLLDRYATDAERRVGFYDTANTTVLEHAADPDVFIAHYQRWFDDRDALLGELSEFLGVDVRRAPVKIRPHRSSMPATEAADIRARSTTAAALGYR